MKMEKTTIVLDGDDVTARVKSIEVDALDVGEKDGWSLHASGDTYIVWQNNLRTRVRLLRSEAGRLIAERVGNDIQAREPRSHPQGKGGGVIRLLEITGLLRPIERLLTWLTPHVDHFIIHHPRIWRATEILDVPVLWVKKLWRRIWGT